MTQCYKCGSHHIFGVCGNCGTEQYTKPTISVIKEPSYTGTETNFMLAFVNQPSTYSHTLFSDLKVDMVKLLSEIATGRVGKLCDPVDGICIISKTCNINNFYGKWSLAQGCISVCGGYKPLHNPNYPGKFTYIRHHTYALRLIGLALWHGYELFLPLSVSIDINKLQEIAKKYYVKFSDAQFKVQTRVEMKKEYIRKISTKTEKISKLQRRLKELDLEVNRIKEELSSARANAITIGHIFGGEYSVDIPGSGSIVGGEFVGE